MRRRQGVTTLQDIANLAGVSRATASRALADSPLLSTKTKQRIRALAKEHNYRVNERARDLRLRRSRVVSVVFMLDIKSEQHMSDPFFLEMLGGIADRLAEYDYDLLLAHAPIKNIIELRDSRVFRHSDGVIFVGQGEQHRQLCELAAGDVPVVAWGGNLPDRTYCLVGGENEHGGYLATKHLLSLGHERVAFCGSTRPPEIAARYDGYKKALVEAGVAPAGKLQVDVPYDMHKARQVFLDVVADGLKFDAVVCSSDVMALAAIAAFNEAGLAVPQHVAVVGYDDIGLAAYSSPPLTTIRQNIRWAGRVLVESVLGLINGEHVADTTLASTLVVRQSCGAALKSKHKAPTLSR
jgi:DNA-binding LacI/PurR family transcriptional regulator